MSIFANLLKKRQKPYLSKNKVSLFSRPQNTVFPTGYLLDDHVLVHSELDFRKADPIPTRIKRSVGRVAAV